MPTDAVREFYERFPYPHNHPGHTTSPTILPSSFDPIRHHVWGGRWPEGRQFRALVAGGGTGDAVVGLGLSLARRGVNAEIHYIDLSVTSAEIARRRAEAAGVRNATFEVGPIEHVAARADRYDYIDLCGVLPVVPAPDELLAVLTSVLADDGAIGVMSYGRLGRTGVEPFRNLYRAINGSSEVNVPLARALANGLPPTNWLAMNRRLGSELGHVSDIEFADRLLAPHEFAYSVSELSEMFGRAGLTIRTFLPGLIYDPARFLRDPSIRARLANLDYIASAQVAENLHGDINKHVFYATKTPRSRLDIGAILALDEARFLPRNIDCEAVAIALERTEASSVSIGFMVDMVERHVTIRVAEDAPAFFRELAFEPTVGSMRRRVGIKADAVKRLCEALVSIEALHFEVP